MLLVKGVYIVSNHLVEKNLYIEQKLHLPCTHLSAALNSKTFVAYAGIASVHFCKSGRPRHARDNLSCTTRHNIGKNIRRPWKKDALLRISTDNATGLYPFPQPFHKKNKKTTILKSLMILSLVFLGICLSSRRHMPIEHGPTCLIRKSCGLEGTK